MICKWNLSCRCQARTGRGLLDGGTVGERVSVRDAQLDEIGATLLEGQEQRYGGLLGREARGHERHKDWSALGLGLGKSAQYALRHLCVRVCGCACVKR